MSGQYALLFLCCASSHQTPSTRGTTADKENYVSLLSDLRTAFDSTSAKYGECNTTNFASPKDLTSFHRSDDNTPELVLVPSGRCFLECSCDSVLTLWTVEL